MFTGHQWLGGVNYIRNLLSAIITLEGRRIAPILILGKKANPAIVGEFDFVPTLRTPSLDRLHPAWILRRAMKQVRTADRVLERYLVEHGVTVLSHSGHLGTGASLPCVDWIPDFQHRYLPELFSEAELARRDQWIAQMCQLCDRVLVSSEVAADELRCVHPAFSDKIRVLHFSSGLLHGAVLPSPNELVARYKIPPRFIHVPNQFWAHKNHILLVEALRILHAQGRAVTVVATGRIEDPRNPQHAARLMASVRECGLTESFRVLGVVPYADMLGLMRHSVAVANPSLFEGWSTSVEEAKSMGKQVLLSDIPVHREQVPDRGLFFDPHDAAAAADAIWHAWSSFNPKEDDGFCAAAARALPARMHKFASNYQSIVLDVALQRTADVS